MTDIKISALPTIAQGSVGVATDSIPITQGAVTYKVTPTALVFSSINANSTGSGSVVLSTSPVINAPTGIVKADVGLGNVDNTSDATKNAATATLTNKTLTSPVINAPTGIVKADVGLGNVDNTSDATKNAATATLTNKTLTSPVINAPTGIVKADVGLGNVDNTSDATKNAATATLTNKTLTNPSYSGATADAGTVTTIDINGGTVDGTVIGGAVPAAVSATTVRVSGNVKLARGNLINFSDSEALNTLISGDTSDNMLLWAAGAERARITSTGLSVTGGISATGAVIANGFKTTGFGVTAVPTGSAFLLQQEEGSLTRSYSAGADAATYGVWTHYAVTAGGAPQPIFTAAHGNFSVNGRLTTTGLKEDTSGNLGIGTTAQTVKLEIGTRALGSQDPSYKLIVNRGVTGQYAEFAATNGAANINGVNGNGGAIIFLGDGVERARIDASGNLGLGVVPSAWSGIKAVQIGNGSIGSTGFETDVFNNVYSNGSFRYIATGIASYYSQSNGNNIWYTAPSGTAGQPISFTQAMTLDASGNLLVGATGNPTDSRLHVSGRVGIVNAISDCLLVSATGTDNSGYVFLGSGSATRQAAYFSINGANVGRIECSSTSTTYATSSDARLKTNVVNAPDAASLIDSLQVRQFDWKSDGSHQRYGFVAQELYEVAPEAVSKPQDPDEMMAVDYSKLVPMLVKEIQSLRQRLATAGI
jgi:hypothetical protein